MITLGAKADQQKATDHCADNADRDVGFCSLDIGVFQKTWWLAKRLTYRVPTVPEHTDLGDKRIRAAVIAAPVGVPVYDVDAVDIPIWIIRAERDSNLSYPFHADHIHTLMSHDHDYTVVPGLEHYAFLSPFPKSIESSVGAPAQDPDGFDRAAFLDDMNAQIAQYFKNALVP